MPLPYASNKYNEKQMQNKHIKNSVSHTHSHTQYNMQWEKRAAYSLNSIEKTAYPFAEE